MPEETPPIGEAQTEPPVGCPMTIKPPVEGGSNRDWWPNAVNLKILQKNPEAIDPMDDGYDYRAEVQTLDFAAFEKDFDALLTDSQDWWPADFGHYGPLFVRMTWHAAGTYRVQDGRGGAGRGMQRFAPVNSWPDNVSLDKARRLLWPLKKKYGKKISWSDLIAYAGNRAMEHMGFTTAGFAFGRPDFWEPEEDIYWGAEHEWLGTQERYAGSDRTKLENPLGATTMGLIYVNPEGPEGVPDPVAAAVDIRETFGRMAMNDVETAALIVGGHTFGKTHGNGDADLIGPEPEAAPLEAMGLGWSNPNGTGVGNDTVTSGLEVIWTHTPTKWDNSFLEILYGNEWELFKSPAGANQWRPKGGAWADSVPMAQGSGKTHPSMLTTDLSMRMDPVYEKITRRWLDHPEELAQEYAKAWFKLIHRDMGPVTRYLGPLVPKETWAWQDIVPAGSTPSAEQVAKAKAAIADSGLTVPQLVSTAWKAASSYRNSDMRGGANGGRIRLQPQLGWEVNEPDELAPVIRTLEGIQEGSGLSFADIVVLAGNVGVEKAAKAAGFDVEVPFTGGRGDATQEQTDPESFSYLEPKADGFRNYAGKGLPVPPEYQLIDRANQLNLTGPETVTLIGGLRVLDTNYGGSKLGVLTDKPGALTTDYFVNLLDMGTKWAPSSADDGTYVGKDRKTGAEKFTASRVDLLLGSNSQLRSWAEVYGEDDAKEKFVKDFVAAWSKVMDADRFDIQK